MEVKHIGKRLASLATVFLVLLASINTFHASFLLVAPSLRNEDVAWTTTTTIRRSKARRKNLTGIVSSFDRPLCPRLDIREGQWLPKTLNAIPYIPRNLHLRCRVENFDYDNPVGPWKTWEWTPFNTSCQFSTWSPDLFCTLLAFSTVTIMGDSLSWEHYSSLLQLLGERVHQTDQFRSRERNHVQLACKKSGRMRGTKIVWRNVAHLNASVVAESIRADFPTVLILNKGAHYQNDTDLVDGLRETFSVLKEWKSDCTRRKLKCNLFWRTSVPGHPDCVNFTEPVNDFHRMETFIMSPTSYNNETWKYKWMWYDFQRQNELILKELNEFDKQNGLQHQILDAYDTNLLRPDGHRWHQGDCLHNCYPGTMDVYSRLFLHFLQMVRTVQDAEDLIERFRRRFLNQTVEATHTA
jgi:hypothetical protein